jgi:hypothetical protein
VALHVTPGTGAFDPFVFGMMLAELPLYTLVITWIFEQANRSMAVALAFHAGGHLDRIENELHVDVRIHAMHLAVLAVLAAIAARSLAKVERPVAVTA